MLFFSKINNDVTYFIWDHADKIASYVPNFARVVTPIPLALQELIRITLYIPAKSADHFVNFGRRIVKEKKFSRSGIKAVKYALLTPFSPLIGLAKAVQLLAKMSFFPVHTAKLKRLDVFVKKFLRENYSNLSKTAITKQLIKNIAKQFRLKIEASSYYCAAQLQFYNQEELQTIIKRVITAINKVEKIHVDYKNQITEPRERLEEEGKALNDKLVILESRIKKIKNIVNGEELEEKLKDAESERIETNDQLKALTEQLKAITAAKSRLKNLKKVVFSQFLSGTFTTEQEVNEELGLWMNRYKEVFLNKK